MYNAGKVFDVLELINYFKQHQNNINFITIETNN